MGCGANVLKAAPAGPINHNGTTSQCSQNAKTGQGSDWKSANVYAQKLPPLMVLPDESCRQVLSESLYRLNPALAMKMAMPNANQMPSEACALQSWRRCHYGLVEEEDGLYLMRACQQTKDRERLTKWSGIPPPNMQIEALPVQLVRGGTKEREDKKVKNRHGEEGIEEEVEAVLVETIEFLKEPKTILTQLYPFLIRWQVEGKRMCFVIGCEEEASCIKWVAMLKIYANVGRRQCGSMMWKLNQNVVRRLSENHDTDATGLQELGDLQNWRRRLCYLDQLLSYSALCMTYISEKSDAEECVASILAGVGDGDVTTLARIRRLPAVNCPALDAMADEKVKASVEQYEVAVMGGHYGSDVAGSQRLYRNKLPARLFPFQAVQSDDCQGGNQQTIFAFETEIMRERWLMAIENAAAKLYKNTDLPPLKIVESS